MPPTNILDATLRLIGERGLESVTHRSAAAAAGVSLGAISHHFGTRERLLEAALTHAARQEIDRLERVALELATSTDADDWLERTTGALAVDPVVRLASYEFLLASARDEGYRELMRDWYDAHKRIAELALRAAGSPEPRRHAEMVVAYMSGAMLKQLAYPVAGWAIADQLRELIARLAAPIPTGSP